MKRKVRYIKAVILVLDLICIFLGIRFILKMEELGQDQLNQVTIRLAKKNDIPKEEQNYILDGLGKTGSFIQRYDEIRLAIGECKNTIWKYQHEYQTWEEMYNAKLFIDARAAALYEDKEENPYIERYFHIEKETVRDFDDIDGYEVLSDVESAGECLPVGEKIWLRYVGGDTFPVGLLIGNPEINIRYHGAGVGMEPYLIKEKIPEAVEGTAMSDGETVGYLKCEDTHYVYYFLESEGQISFLYITRK